MTRGRIIGQAVIVLGLRPDHDLRYLSRQRRARDDDQSAPDDRSLIEFRPADQGDLDEIHRVYWLNDPDPPRPNPWFAHVLRTGQLALAIATDRVVGFAGYRRLGGTGVVSDCFVDPDFHAQGIGTRMLRFLLPDGDPVMTLASADPKAHSLYRRLGMLPVTDCPYLSTTFVGGTVAVREVDRYPVPAADLEHLLVDLGARLVEVGTSAAAVTGSSIETSVIGPGDEGPAVIAALLDFVGGRVEIQMSEQHLAYQSFEWEEAARDTLMASSGAEVPDHTRITFNGDLLRVG